MDYVLYADTDSLFLNIGQFIRDQVGPEWDSLKDESKITFIRNIAHTIEKYVNERIYKEIQRQAYNSNITDLRIQFKQELIAKAGLFVKKKKYSLLVTNKDGVSMDEIETKGLEIVRSDTPEVVRPMLVNFMSAILHGASDDELCKIIEKDKKDLSKVYPEEIASNVGVSSVGKYIENDQPIKGAPWHVKGVLNYRKLLRHLGLTDKYEDIHDASKTKVVYLKKNKFGAETMSFIRWPKEFDTEIHIDYQKQIEKTYTGKIRILLEPMKKEGLLDGMQNNLDAFF